MQFFRWQEKQLELPFQLEITKGPLDKKHNSDRIVGPLKGKKKLAVILMYALQDGNVLNHTHGV